MVNVPRPLLPAPERAEAGILASPSLVEALLNISNEVACMDKPLPPIQAINTSSAVRRIKLLIPLFEDIRRATTPLPPSSLLCLAELFSVVRATKALLHDCASRSALWSLLQAEHIAEQFQAATTELARALDILPLSLMDVTGDVREQIELLHKQARRSQLVVEPRDRLRREELLPLLVGEGHSSCSSRKEKFSFSADWKKEEVEEMMVGLGLRRASDYEREIEKLAAEMERQAGTGGLVVVSNIKKLMALVSYFNSVVLQQWGEEKEEREENTSVVMEYQTAADGGNHRRSLSSYHSALVSVPDEFKCSISLELMRDPVIVATGHTYDRSSIARWLNSGHQTCPKSGMKLLHSALITNHALKSLIHQWCHDNHVSLTSSGGEGGSGREDEKSPSPAVVRYEHPSAAVEAIRMSADFLVGKLATGSPDIQRQAAFELRLLAKSGMDNRRMIAEAGAIPFLVALLRSHDARTQENAVTALLNLSILHNNKLLIMEATGAMEGIVDVLQMGRSMEARENAAAAIFSLSMTDESKVRIGKHPRVIPALVALLREGTAAGKKDAVTAIFNLAVCNGNKASIVGAGMVPLLLELLTDENAGITDEALAVLMVLAGCREGLKEMRESRVAGSILVDLMRFGSPKGKENSVGLLLAMCRRNGGEEVARRLLTNPRSIPSLQTLAADGTPKARRKADALLRLFNEYCSESPFPPSRVLQE